ncbi:MAG: exonuclease domain-containing protein [Methylophilaceae bacterium]
MKMQPLAFVDLETTGATATVDRITEIGIILVDEAGVREWSTLVNPQTRIPEFIERLTGITNEMVEDAPTFDRVANEVAALLAGHTFIAHNARFDYGFLKNEFKRLDRSFKATVLCTVKLSRKLYPTFPRHNLDSLIERHGLQVTDRHRALGDAKLIHQFWNHIKLEFPKEAIDEAVSKLTARSSLPSNIDASVIDELPDGAGVYLFYAENDLPLYIGKSTNIKQRVMSHFSADHSSGKEMSLSQQVRRIDWIETAGELGALLTEARLIKEMLPTHNHRLRRSNELCAWQLEQRDGHLRPVLKWASDLDFGTQENLYGLFHTKRDAIKALRAIAEEFQLCLGVLELEKVAVGRSCFGVQLKRCLGACSGKEKPLDHSARLSMAMSKLKLSAWKHKGPVGIQEGDEVHIIDHWCYLGTAKDESEMFGLLEQGRPAFDRDTYMILNKAMKNRNLVELNKELR